MSLTFRVGDLLPAERCAPGALFAPEWPAEHRAAWRERLRADPTASAYPAVPPAPNPSDADGADGADGADAAGRREREGSAAAADRSNAQLTRVDRIEAAFAARVAEAARTGWAVDDQLIEAGLIAIAVPVRDPRGTVVCALSAVSHVSRHAAESLRALALAPLLDTARRLEKALAEPVNGPSPHPLGATRPGISGLDTITAGMSSSGPAMPGQSRSGQTRSGQVTPGQTRSGQIGSGQITPAEALDASKQQLGPHFLRSLARGLDILAAFDQPPAHPSPPEATPDADHDRAPTLSSLAQATGLPRATARRALITLQQEGYVELRGRHFVPLPRILELGYSRLSGLTVEQLAAPHLARLAARVGESASAAVLDGARIAYVARVATRRIMQVNITVGTRFPAHATSMGRVLLAALPEPSRRELLAAGAPRSLTRFTVTDPAELATLLHRAAEDGFALVDQELEEGLRSIAAPVRDAGGTIVAAVNISMHAAGERPEAARDRVLPALLDAAEAVSADFAAMGRHLVIPYR
jgi:IclR family pca regulon transcriptional regulator